MEKNYNSCDIEKETKYTSSVEMCKMVTSSSAVDEMNCTEEMEESELEDGEISDSSSSSNSSSYFDSASSPDESADLASMPDAVDEGTTHLLLFLSMVVGFDA